MSEEEASSKRSEILLQALGNLPTIQVSEQDVYAIEQALQGYSGYVLSAGKLTPEQQQCVARMRVVQDKLAQNMRQVRSGHAITDGFAFEDIEVMADALAGFVHAISRRVPKSSEREGVLADLRLLRQRLEKLLDAMIANVQE